MLSLIMRRVLRAAVAFAILLCLPAQAQTRLRGEPAALAAAERLLEQAGGRDAWRRQTFFVVERGYLRSGEVAELRISRDFVAGSRLIERRTLREAVHEWVSPYGGWVTRNGERQVMGPEELAIELQGLSQEPYSVYHRIALNDGSLRLELRDAGASLYVYEGDARLLCWFRIAPNGTLRGWGNFYDGAINEHFYGPLADMGDANLPRWGAAIDGGFRFEYVSARLGDTPLREPAPARR